MKFRIMDYIYNNRKAVAKSNSLLFDS